MSIPDELKRNILRRARKALPTQIKWRRHLHQYPELSFFELETTSFLKKTVRELGLKIIPVRTKTGLVAELKGKQPGRTAAVRTDIDALPVKELTDLPFKSKIDDRMHACGHDVHMAVALGTADILRDLRSELPGTVRFIFQPAEEMPPGGARPMVAAGVVKDVGMIFALHVDPQLATGKISLRDGSAMGSVTDFDLTIIGRAGHAARPHEAVDAIVTAAEVIGSIQTVVSRDIDPIQAVAVTFGGIQGGTARNVICDCVTLTGTARALSPATARKLNRMIRRTAASVCRARGARAEIKMISDFPVLVNHPRANSILADNFGALFSRRNIETTEKVLGGEDFAFYLQKTCGAMFRLGTMNKSIKADQPWHSPRFVVDEEAMYYGTSLMVAAVIDYLKGGHE